MNTESIAGTAAGRVWIRLVARAMESRFRYRFFAPEKMLAGVDGLQGSIALELGCGMGFFTLPAARMIGDKGSLLAMDILQESVELVAKKVAAAGLENARVMKGDALATGLENGGFTLVLLFGVVPAPMLPVSRLLPELHRVLKPGGILAVWPAVPGIARPILRSGLFERTVKRNGVLNFKRL